jgi:hypothetical protein
MRYFVDAAAGSFTARSRCGKRPSEVRATPDVIKVPCRIPPSLGELMGPLFVTPANNPKPL